MQSMYSYLLTCIKTHISFQEFGMMISPNLGIVDGENLAVSLPIFPATTIQEHDMLTVLHLSWM